MRHHLPVVNSSVSLQPVHSDAVNEKLSSFHGQWGNDPLDIVFTPFGTMG